MPETQRAALTWKREVLRERIAIFKENRPAECQECQQEPPVGRLRGKHLCIVCLTRAAKGAR